MRLRQVRYRLCTGTEAGHIDRQMDKQANEEHEFCACDAERGSAAPLFAAPLIATHYYSLFYTAALLLTFCGPSADPLLVRCDWGRHTELVPRPLSLLVPCSRHMLSSMLSSMLSFLI